jgi:hypothetical protein
MVMEGKLLDAFDKYYHDDVSMQENQNPPVIGKAANRRREVEFLNHIVEFRKAAVQAVAAGNDLSFVVWSYDYTHNEWGVRNYTQVSYQKWQDGKIIREQFFYAN